jgi:hypothetical protein
MFKKQVPCKSWNVDHIYFEKDKTSSHKYEKYLEYQDKRNLINEEHKFQSSWPDVSDLNGHYLSNILINLKLDPNWVDVQLCIESFRPIDIPQSISGKFDLMCNFCIQLIENKLEYDESQ